MPLDNAGDRVIFRAEHFMATVSEMLPLWREHYLEVALDQDEVPLDPDLDFYMEAERTGTLRHFVARRGEKMIGYATVFVRSHPHYRSTLFATFDLYYLISSERRGWLGVSLFRAIERALRREGITIIMAGTKIHASPHTTKRGQPRGLDVGPIFAFLGWKAAEVTWRKCLAPAVEKS